MAVPPYHNVQRSQAADISVLPPPLVDPTTMAIHMPQTLRVPRFASTAPAKSKVEAKSKISPVRRTRDGTTRRRATPFPLRLMQILEDAEFSDIITWMPDGKTFIILRPKAFVNKVLPATTLKSVQYTSFTRKLIRWGFSRCEDGTGEFYHPKFRRGRFDLVEKMITSNSAAGNDAVTEEDDDKEGDRSFVAAPRSSDTKEIGETRRRPAQCLSTVTPVASSPLPLTSLASVPGIGASLSSQRLLAASTHPLGTDLLQIEMETLRLRQRLHVAICSSLSANLLPPPTGLFPVDCYSMLSSPSMDMSGLLTTSPLLDELRAARASSAIRLGLMNNPALLGSRDSVRLAYPVTSLDEILLGAAVAGRHLDPTLTRR